MFRTSLLRREPHPFTPTDLYILKDKPLLSKLFKLCATSANLGRFRRRRVLYHHRNRQKFGQFSTRRELSRARALIILSGVSLFPLTARPEMHLTPRAAAVIITSFIMETCREYRSEGVCLSRRSLINFKCSAIKATVAWRAFRRLGGSAWLLFCASGRLQRTQIGALEPPLETFLSRLTVISASEQRLRCITRVFCHSQFSMLELKGAMRVITVHGKFIRSIIIST